MFGQLKESVLTNLEKEYAQNGETKFKKQLCCIANCESH